MAGTTEDPLRIAVIGAGPAGFYAAGHLLQQTEHTVSVDMFDRLMTPYGLVRHGVAPDHLKIKTVTAGFARTAEHPRFRFFGNVEFGRDITVEDLQRHYHQAIFTTGAQTDRRMDIPGEDLSGSHPATAFVAWYNGHPDYCHAAFDLSHENVAIVGVGNVALDVARILCLTPAELRATDMPAYAVDALSASRVRRVYLLGRRGPAQAAFTNPELKELGELADTSVIVTPGEAALDPLSQADVDEADDRMLSRKVELIQQYAGRPPESRSRELHLRFLVSPTRLFDDGMGHVSGLELARNVLVKSPTGSLSARATQDTETIPCGLVFRSVGYRGLPLPGLPFNERWGVISNEHGRVTDPDSGEAFTGAYVAGWIKRGPSGVIGTNKPDAVETVSNMLADAAAGSTWSPETPAPGSVDGLLRHRGVASTTFDDWRTIDAAELAEGARCGRPRVKFDTPAEMRSCLQPRDGCAAG